MLSFKQARYIMLVEDILRKKLKRDECVIEKFLPRFTVCAVRRTFDNVMVNFYQFRNFVKKHLWVGEDHFRKNLRIVKD